MSIEPPLAPVWQRPLQPHRRQYEYFLPGMSYLTHSTASTQSTEGIGQGTITRRSQQHRCVSFTCYARRLLSKTTVRIQHRFTSSMTIQFLTCFISTDLPSMMETRMICSISEVERDGTANYGGTTLHTFAKDGETFYLDQHPTWIFASSVHMARRSQTCWPIHLPFLSLSITPA